METKLENTGAFVLEYTSNNVVTTTTTILDAAEVHQPYEELESTHFVSYQFQMESFDITVDLPSKPIAPIPAISPEDTKAEKAQKVYEIEKAFPKMGLELYFDHGTGWKRRALVPVQNRGAEYYASLLYPYLGSSKILLMSKISKLGIKMIPLFTGTQQHGTLEFNDYIVLSGTWSQSVSLIPKLTEHLELTRSVGINVGAEGITQIAPYRPTRGLIWLQNSGQYRVYISFNADTSVLMAVDSNQEWTPSGIYLEPGAYCAYESLKYNLPQPIYARALEGNSRLDGMEAY